MILSPRHVQVLTIVRDNPQCVSSVVAFSLGFKEQWATSSVAGPLLKMVRLGLLRRTKHNREYSGYYYRYVATPEGLHEIKHHTPAAIDEAYEHRKMELAEKYGPVTDPVCLCCGKPTYRLRVEHYNQASDQWCMC